MRATCRLTLAGLILVASFSGCGPSGPSRLVPPAIDSTAVVAGVIQVDANGDGRLDGGELATAPAFAPLMADLDDDGCPHPGVHSGVCRVELTGKGNDGKPLAAEYNTSSTLGAAVGGLVPKGGVLAFSLE